MATADQIKSLIRAHFDQDNERFRTFALQISAYEARLRHLKLANEVKNLNDIVESCPFETNTSQYNRSTIDLQGILSVVCPQIWFFVQEQKKIRRQLNLDFGRQ